jgi:protein-tyrosine phosphatase
MAAVLFVCLGNICRSPAAQAIMQQMAAKDPRFADLHVQSCGLGDWHLGQLPDERMRESSKARGLILSSRAQLFRRSFFDTFDYILAADNEVLHQLYHYAVVPEHKAKIHLVTAFSETYKNEDIPDPYYGGAAAFDHVLDMLEDSCSGLLQHLALQKE